MINIRVDKPIKKESMEECSTLIAQIRDLLSELETTLRVATSEKVLMTRTEVAQLLRCDIKKIPVGIPRIRNGTNPLFEKEDVYEFLESRKRTVKK